MSLAKMKWDRQWARAKSEYHKKTGDEYGLLSYTYFVLLMSYLMYKYERESFCLAIIEPVDKQRSCFQEAEVKNDRYLCSLIKQNLTVGESFCWLDQKKEKLVVFLRKSRGKSHEWLEKLYTIAVAQGTEMRFASGVYEIKPYESWTTILRKDDTIFLNMCIEKALSEKTK